MNRPGVKLPIPTAPFRCQGPFCFDPSCLGTTHRFVASASGYCGVCTHVLHGVPGRLRELRTCSDVPQARSVFCVRGPHTRTRSRDHLFRLHWSDLARHGFLHADSRTFLHVHSASWRDTLPLPVFLSSLPQDISDERVKIKFLA